MTKYHYTQEGDNKNGKKVEGQEELETYEVSEI